MPLCLSDVTAQGSVEVLPSATGWAGSRVARKGAYRELSWVRCVVQRRRTVSAVPQVHPDHQEEEEEDVYWLARGFFLVKSSGASRLH